MNSKLLLIKAITLLYRESVLNSPNGSSGTLVAEVISLIPIPEDTMDLNTGRDIIINLRTTALWLAESVNERHERATVLQRIRVNVSNDDSLYDAFITGIDGAAENEDANKNACIAIKKELRNYVKQIRVKEIISKASHRARFEESSIDWKSFVKDVTGQLEPYIGSDADEISPAHVDSVNLSDAVGVKRVLAAAMSEISDSGILQTQWQGVNRMMGDYMGMRRGDFVVVGALQHNFKTGFTLGIAKGWALYNKAVPDVPGKKPMIMHISVENNLTDNLLWLYTSLKENETGQPCSTTDVDLDAVTAYVSARMAEQGYAFHMARYNPSDFTYHDLFDLIMKFEAEGYEIHAMVFDYLNMISKKGCNGGANGADIRDLFRRVRNFTSPRRILFVTPHQLSPDAKFLLRQGVDNFVKEVANKGYWDSCKAIDQEVDLELIIHIEKRNGKSYLCVQRGKHRKVSITPEEHLYCVLPFAPVGGIVDDVNGNDISLTHVGGKSNGAGHNDDGGEWWS